jgi:hypothetical protein
MAENLLISHNWKQLKSFFEAIYYRQIPSGTVGVSR